MRLRVRHSAQVIISIIGCLLASAANAEPPQTKAKPAPAAPDAKKSAPVTAAKSGIDVSKPYGYHLEPILERIKATSDQRTKITQVVQSYRSTIVPLRDQYKEKQQEFITSMISGSAAETIMSKQVELGHLSSEITSKYCLMRLEVRRLLSPEQILQFESYGREHGWNH